ncbi:tubulin glycylase 3A-like isoform X2 [Leptopilina boulardi]|uniref:tubulin glycylase 3A-like isoform X2 n=1 Tax=Leptopilina boulardi TaxID=63433 RepID=UPI0021F5AADB|nr:tubulin glycylase 3A-like isoform X2 [Leptopilina boulardi]
MQTIKNNRCLLRKEKSSSNDEWKKDIKSESSENLSIETLDRKESPINPYNRVEYPPDQWLPVNENTDVAISSLEHEFILKTHMKTCSKESLKTENFLSSCRTDEACSSEDMFQKQIYKKIENRVKKAVKKHKVFLIRGELPKLREALENRGWIQKYESIKTRSLPYGQSQPCLESKSLGDIQQSDGTLNEKALIFSMLCHIDPDFIWDCRNNFTEWDNSIKSSTLLNRLQNSIAYTSKLGMANILQDSQWLYEKDVADVNFPRSYNLSRELTDFIKDFRQTAAAGFLRWFVEMFKDEEMDKDWDTLAVNIGQVEFARKRCEEYIAELKQENIDNSDLDISEDDWNCFCDDYNSLQHKVAEISNSRSSSSSSSSSTSIQSRFKEVYTQAVSVLEQLKEIDCQYNLNGTRNIWILKPNHLCCGVGISISHNLQEIQHRVETKPKDYFIIQKYIEDPLLVKGTKFDIRLWYLVTSSFPLSIWIFKEALLRFSSKPYSFSSYHEVIHICNTAIQERYDYERRRRRKRGDVVETTETVRDQGWDCEKLNECLKEMGYDGEPFYDTIYPRMSQAIVMTMLAAQESMDKRRCSFELYGADFMVMEDLSVWLIEINTNPRMHPPSSKITQRLYNSVLDSLVKVILDLPLNPSADTGGFALAYKQTIPELRPYLGPCLFAVGKSMKLHECPEKKQDDSRAIICNSWSKENRARTAPPSVSRLRDPQVVDFIDYLNSEG